LLVLKLGIGAISGVDPGRILDTNGQIVNFPLDWIVESVIGLLDFDELELSSLLSIGMAGFDFLNVVFPNLRES
jgi:hypothetical protein